MSYQSDRCVFCGENADTREHIFAKCFFDRPYPNNLPTIPSCRKCNNSFSLDEQYLMYLIDYLKSVEYNNGEFVRTVAQKTFFHNEELENRMINSLSVEGSGKPIFSIESDRISSVIRKIAQCLFMYHFNKKIPSSQIICRWLFLSQLSVIQKLAIEQINFTIIQEALVKYYCTPQEVSFCLSDFFYGSAEIISC